MFRGAAASVLDAAERILRVLTTMLWRLLAATRLSVTLAKATTASAAVPVVIFFAGALASWPPAGGNVAAAALSAIAAAVTRVFVPRACRGRGCATRAVRRAVVAVPVATAAVVVVTSTTVTAAAQLVRSAAAVSAAWATGAALVAIVRLVGRRPLAVVYHVSSTIGNFLKEFL